MKGLKKILFFIILIFTVSFSINVNAEEIIVSTIEEFTEVITNGGEIKLDGDIEIPASTAKKIILTNDVTIDLNSHQIITGSYLQATGSTLTVKDTSVEKQGVITNNGANAMVVVVAENGKFVLESGKMHSSSTTAPVYLLLGEVEINGGVVENTYAVTKNSIFAISSANAQNKLVVNDGTITSNNSAIRVYGQMIINGGNISADGFFGIIDQNNLEVNGGNISSTNNYAIVAMASSLATIKGGNISSTNSYAINANNTSSLTIEDGNITSVNNGALVIGSEVNLNISGAKIEATAASKYAITLGKDDEVNIDGGTIKSKGTSIYSINSNIININDGTITSESDAAILSLTGNVNVKGGTISSNATIGTILLIGNSELKVDGGTIYSKAGNAINAQKNAKVTINDGVIESDGNLKNALYLDGNNDVTINGGTFIAPQGYGIVGFENVNVVINDATVNSYYFTIAGNGSQDASHANFEINGGTFTSSNAAAIYFPQIEGINKITGGTFIGLSGIEIRAGKLDITGGKFIATNNELNINPNGNGTTTLGSALAVIQHTTKQPIIVNVTGGEFSGMASIIKANPQENPEEDYTKVHVYVSGGTYKTKVEENLIVEGYTEYQIDDKYVVGKTYKLDNENITNGLEDNIDIIVKTIVTNGIVNWLDVNTINAIKDAVENNKKISTQVDMKEVTKEAISDDQEEIIISKLEDNQKIGTYFNIDVIVKADDEKIGNITELPNKLKLTIKLSDELLDVDNGYDRKYSVIRLHNGVAQTLDTTNNNEGTLSFESDQFSLYAVVYEDVLNESKKNNIEVNPNTIDNLFNYITLGTISVIGLVMLKKKIN